MILSSVHSNQAILDAARASAEDCQRQAADIAARMRIIDCAIGAFGRDRDRELRALAEAALGDASPERVARAEADFRLGGLEASVAFLRRRLWELCAERDALRASREFQDAAAAGPDARRQIALLRPLVERLDERRAAYEADEDFTDLLRERAAPVQAVSFAESLRHACRRLLSLCQGESSAEDRDDRLRERFDEVSVDSLLREYARCREEAAQARRTLDRLLAHAAEDDAVCAKQAELSRGIVELERTIRSNLLASFVRQTASTSALRRASLRARLASADAFARAEALCDAAHVLGCLRSHLETLHRARLAVVHRILLLSLDPGRLRLCMNSIPLDVSELRDEAARDVLAADAVLGAVVMTPGSRSLALDAARAAGASEAFLDHVLCKIPAAPSDGDDGSHWIQEKLFDCENDF